MFTGNKHPFLFYRAPAVAYALAIVGMSAIPGYDLPDLPFWSFDKIVHLIEFGLLGIFLYRAFRFPRPLKHPYLMTLYCGIPFAALDEVHQLFVPGRHCDVLDFVMDTFGLVLFGAISARLNRPRQTVK